MIAILVTIVVVSLAYWAAAHGRVAHPAARWALAGFVLFQLALVVTQYAERRYWIYPSVPAQVRTVGYVWGLAVVPFVVLPTLLAWAFAALARRLAAWRRRAFPAPPAPAATLARRLERRQFLSTATTLAPLVVTALGTAKAVYQNGTFRVVRRALALPTLPPALDGLRIVHVSDLHAGRFLTGAVLDDIGAAIDGLDADLVCFTGDLVDFDHGHLAESLRLLTGVRSRHGVFVVEGNHDLFQGRERFEREVREAGLPLLLNARTTIPLRGVSLELLGLGWGNAHDERTPALEANMAALIASPAPRADYAILLAHHPHAFDLAALNAIPLTLAGHTHGGQLMLTPTVGIGAGLFKYLSGEYALGDARLVVSNGVGNWFPLRIGAPAEIVELTLRRGGVLGDPSVQGARPVRSIVEHQRQRTRWGAAAAAPGLLIAVRWRRVDLLAQCVEVVVEFGRRLLG